MSKIVQLKKEGINEYPITIPEAVIDNNGITVKDKIKSLEDTIKNIQPGGSSYDDTEIKQELTELSAEVSGLSEKIENLPSAESDVFKAIYGTTTYEEIKAAYDSGKVVHCDYKTYCYVLSRILDVAAYFDAMSAPNSYRITCGTDGWTENTYQLELKTNKVTSLSSASTDTQYPSAKAVYDALQNLPQGGGATTPDWDAKEGESGFIKNRTHYINGLLITAAGYYDTPSRNIIYKGNTYTLPDDGTKLQLEFGPPIYAYYQIGNSKIYVETNSPDYLEMYPIKVLEEIVPLSDIYIPDTIARKSDIIVDSNVADPVVWKYICNPLIIEDGTEVPDELYDEDKDWLKYEYPAMYKFYDGTEFKFCAKVDDDRLTDSKNQDWYINMQTFYME